MDETIAGETTLLAADEPPPFAVERTRLRFAAAILEFADVRRYAGAA